MDRVHQATLRDTAQSTLVKPLQQANPVTLMLRQTSLDGKHPWFLVIMPTQGDQKSMTMFGITLLATQCR